MEFLVAGFEIIEQKPGLQGVYEACELPGRICYGSQDKIEPGSAEPFIKRLMKSNHGAPLEHGTIYLKAEDRYSFYSNTEVVYDGNPLEHYEHNPYSKFIRVNNIVYVTTNLRVLVDNNWMDDLYHFCEPTEYHEKRVMVRFTMDRFTGEEFLRHRKASFNRESTRYVAFTKEKFGGGSIKYIVPTWLNDEKTINRLEGFQKWFSINEMCQNVIDYNDGDCELDEVFVWAFALKATEWSYNTLMNRFGWQAQQARTVLPCAICSPLIKTAFVSDWKHFFNLRAIGTTGAPHPQAKELAQPLMEEFINRGLIEAPKLQ
jgi:thymidylate synthase (FAD)